ncbi:tryptophan synthase subunit alpha [Acidothermaceae bacterium B102]|nr:tryptophan synthase subunit alpha [Acidothermaceae bacterium B102]
MSQLDDAFARSKAEGRALLIGYLPAGFPTYEEGVRAITAMVEGGVDAVEVGLPYSDPMMDGPVVQEAVDQALKAGFRLTDLMRTVEAVAALGVPTLVMSYWNPIEKYGVDRFATDLASAGGCGVITPDLIPDEAGAWLAAVDKNVLDPVFLAAPSSTDDRLRVVASVSRGFIYAASTMGITGIRAQVGARAGELVGRLKAVTDTPIAVGLGVSNGKQAAEVAGYADGVIVGSAFVRRLLDASTERAGLLEVRALAAELADGVRSGVPSGVN